MASGQKHHYNDEIAEESDQGKLLNLPANQVTTGLQPVTPGTSRNSDLPLDASEKVYKLERRRWCQLLNMCLAIMLNQVAWISMQSIGNQIAKVYKVKITTVNLLPMMFQIVFVILSVPGNTFIEKKGQHLAVLIGTVCNTMGMVIKCFINVNFFICFVGQFLPALANILIVNSITRVAAVWFGQSERVTAISIMVACQALGVAFGFVMPVIFFSDDMTDEDFKHNAVYFLGLQAGLGIVNMLLNLAIFKAKPDSPPSAAAELEEIGQAQVQENEQSTVKNWCAVATNLHFVLLSVFFGLLQAGQNALGTVVGETVAAFGFSSDDASVFGAVFVAGGVTGSIIIGIILEKTKAYKIAMISISLLSMIASGVLCLTLHMANNAIVAVCCFLIGFGMISVSVPAFDLGSELTYPLNESYSTTWLNIIQNLFSALVALMDSLFIEWSDYQVTGDTRGSFYCYVAEPIISGLALLIALIVRQHLKRTEAEMKDKQCQAEEVKVQEAPSSPIE